MTKRREYNAAYRERVRARPKVVPAVKVCATCKAEKPSADFWKMSASRDGLQSKCKACSVAYEKEKYPPGQRKPGVHKRNLRKLYGMTEGDYQTMLLDQGCRCRICGRHFAEAASEQSRSSDRRPRVDHDHDTGKVRGLLCNTCNRALGMFDDDLATLEAAVAYLAASQDALTVGGE